MNVADQITPDNRDLTNPAIGDKYYIPFWVLLEYLDNAPSDPFISATIINIKSLNATTPAGIQQVTCCDLECLSHLDKVNQFTVYNIPLEYLIKPSALRDWAHRISQWFLEYADHIKP